MIVFSFYCNCCRMPQGSPYRCCLLVGHFVSIPNKISQQVLQKCSQHFFTLGMNATLKNGSPRATPTQKRTPGSSQRDVGECPVPLGRGSLLYIYFATLVFIKMEMEDMKKKNILQGSLTPFYYRS